MAGTQHDIANKFATFAAYDSNLPCAAEMKGNIDLSWMASRTPLCAALANALRRLWDGEEDEHIR